MQGGCKTKVKAICTEQAVNELNIRFLQSLTSFAWEIFEGIMWPVLVLKHFGTQAFYLGLKSGHSHVKFVYCIYYITASTDFLLHFMANTSSEFSNNRVSWSDRQEFTVYLYVVLPVLFPVW